MNKYIVSNPRKLAAVLIFEQLFDLGATIYLTSLPGGKEINPLLIAMWNAPGGLWWLVFLKLSACVMFGLGVPYILKNRPSAVWAPTLIAVAYGALTLWSGYLICATML